MADTIADVGVDALDLPLLAIEDSGFSLDPVARFAEARTRHPWLARISVGYIITEHAAMRDIMRNDASMEIGFNDLVEYMGATGTPWGEFIRGTVQTQSGETHHRLREALRGAFSPRMANRYRGVMREQIEALLDEWLPRGAFDFEEFASFYPISVMCRMIGVPTDIIPSLRASLEALGLAMSMDRKHLPELQRGTLLLEETARRVIAARRGAGRSDGEPDLLEAVLAVREEGQMSEEELVNLLVFMFVGGYDTSKNVITLIMFTLLDKPEVYARCAESLDYTRKAMHETFRYHSPSTATRKVAQEFSFRGVRFPAGTLIMFPWGMSGRDATATENPDSFDPDRKGLRGSHFAFGMGAHICLGQFIGLAQIEEGFHVIARCLKNPRLTGQPGWRPFPGVWGIAGLPIAFDPA
ncbi:cytochrome P450 [Novosphingobium sp. JCM 18896]|uniref:cytochrome P450 n=1 Tax=Novosphingobium sp. JCM 18896 TaxID=2989731 RepID=UPI0022225626|nr:cytochrome P450 [Novosphingobium sp. JCM 18896]MCW1427591.1 cytochrome P450 [Novosphingobium sp. JCM 18896]